MFVNKCVLQCLDWMSWMYKKKCLFTQYLNTDIGTFSMRHPLVDLSPDNETVEQIKES